MENLAYKGAIARWFNGKLYFFPYFLVDEKGGGGAGFPPVEYDDNLSDKSVGDILFDTFLSCKMVGKWPIDVPGYKLPPEWFGISSSDYNKNVLEVWVYLRKEGIIEFEMMPNWGSQVRLEREDLTPFTLPADAPKEEIGRALKLTLASLYPGKNPFQKKYFPDLFKKNVPEGGGPMAFGEGLGWVAVRARAPRDVMAAFKPVKEFKSASWEDAILAFDGELDSLGKVFVSPPIKGWVFLVSPWFGGGKRLDLRLDNTLRLFSEKFGKAVGFACSEKYDWFYWARAQKGDITRLVENFDGLRFVGKPTREEKELLDYATSPQDDWTPTAEDVFNLAGAWSLNPMDFSPGQPTPVGPGWLGICRP